MSSDDGTSNRLGRIVVIAVSLAFATAPLGSILEDLALVTDVDLASSGPLVVIAAAVVLERVVDRSANAFVGFAVATVTCWYVFAWATGLSAERLELASWVLLADTLVFLAAVTTALALTFRAK